MSRIDIKQAHGTTRDDAIGRTRDLLDKFAERRSDLVKSVSWSADGTSAEVKGPAFSGSFKVTDADVVVDLKLALLARPFKGQVQEVLEGRLAKAFQD